jgi:hydroxylamine reductase
MRVFSYQCEEAALGSVCSENGVCGKSAEVSSLQDFVTYALKGLALFAHGEGDLGFQNRELDRFSRGVACSCDQC